MRALMVARFDSSLKEDLVRLVNPELAAWRPEERWSSAELARRLQGFELMTTEEQDPIPFVDQEVIAGAPDLKALLVAGRRPRADMAAATEAGILVCIMPGLNSGGVADLTIVFLILCARRIAPALEQVKAGQWAKDTGPSPMDWVYRNFTGFDLEGRTVGLIGLGAIGAAVAKRLHGFGMRILGYDPYASPEAALGLGVSLVSLKELLQGSDFVSLHAPSTPETRNLLGSRELGLMKPTAYLINTARADLVDEQALHTALGEGKIAGAALDVFHQEPVPEDSPLLTHPSVIMTPHLGGATTDQVYHQSKDFLETIRRLRLGEPLPNLANPEVLSSPRVRYHPPKA